MVLAWDADIHETLNDIPETLRNILLSNQLAPFSMDISRIIHVLARALRIAYIVNLWNSTLNFGCKENKTKQKLHCNWF